MEKKAFLKSNAYSLLPLQQSLKKRTILAEVEPTLQNDTKFIRKFYQIVGALSQQTFPCHVASNTFRNEGFHNHIIKAVYRENQRDFPQKTGGI